MRILVTGHQGYLGRVLAPFLRAAGHTVLGLDSGLYAAAAVTPPDAGVSTMAKDIRDVGPQDLEGFEAVVHLAGLSNDPLGDLDPELTDEINRHASVRLARVARQAGAQRFVFFSSCSVYGAAAADWVDEASPVRPLTAYARSKVRVEEEVATLAAGEFTPTFLRNATAYGASPAPRFDLVLNNLVAWAVSTGRILLKSDGTAWRPLVHVEDIARAVFAVLEAPAAVVHNQILNVGQDGENYQVRALAETVRAAVPESRVEFAPGAETDRRSYRVRFQKIARLLSAFRPVWTAAKGAAELHASYRELGVTAAEFEGPKYRRVDHLLALRAAGRLDAQLRWTDPGAPTTAPSPQVREGRR